MTGKNKAQFGFTLIGVLLLLVVTTIVIMTTISYNQQTTEQSEIDNTILQAQQILGAALQFYVTNGVWPEIAGSPSPGTGIGCLQGNGTTVSGVDCSYIYLPGTLVNPFANGQWSFGTWLPTTPNQQYKYTLMIPINMGPRKTYAIASTIAGMLPSSPGGINSTSSGPPFSWVTDSLPNSSNPCLVTDSLCYVYTQVSVPGSNISNAQAVNFAGLYKHGSCVPVPFCPNDVLGNPMIPQIIVAPVSVSGLNSNSKLYPLSSFTAYATSNNGANAPTNATPPDCRVSGVSYSTSSDCTSGLNGANTGNYWRVCMQVVTEQGDIQTGSMANPNQWGNNVTIFAMTRCSTQNETAGSNFNVYSN